MVTGKPNSYERDLGEVLARAVFDPSSATPPSRFPVLLAERLAAHRERVASLFLAVLPRGDEPEDLLRANLGLAREIIGAGCPTLSHDPRGQTLARMMREKYEIESAYRRIYDECERLRGTLAAKSEELARFREQG